MPRLLLFLLVVVAATGCSHEDGAAGPSTPALVAPHPFPAAAAGVPAGHREVLCPDLRSGGTGLTVRLVVPRQVTSSHREGDGCAFTLGSDPRRALSVQIGPGESLARWRTTSLDPYVADDGDDAVGDVTYRTDAPGLDGAAAEELRWYSFSDGSPTRVVSLLAAGVRLTWSVPDGDPLTARDLDVVRRSVAVVPGTRANCPDLGAAGGRTLTFAPPKDLGWVESEAHRCRIYVAGSPTTLEGGEVDPAPSGIDALAARVRRDPEASGVRLERGAAVLGGERADRLSWEVVRAEETESYEPAGTWRIVVVEGGGVRVRWGATPQWWRDHRAVFDQLVASVAVSPGRPSQS